MEREAKTSIVLLDACRDNPLARNLARNMGTRSAQIGQGLAEVKTGVGTLIGYSTQPGNVALDGADRNSPYAEALLRHIEVPGRDISGVLIAVRNDVLKATDGRQVPWEHTSLTGQVYLKLDAPSPTPSPAPQMPNYDRELEISFWNTVKDSKSPAIIETYLQRYPDRGRSRALPARMIQEHGPGRGAAAGRGCDAGAAAAGRHAGPRAVAADRAAAGGLLSGSCRRQLGRPNEGGARSSSRAARARTCRTDEPYQAALDAVKGAARPRLPARVRRRHRSRRTASASPRPAPRDRAGPKVCRRRQASAGRQEAEGTRACAGRATDRVTIDRALQRFPRSFTKAY